MQQIGLHNAAVVAGPVTTDSMGAFSLLGAILPAGPCERLEFFAVFEPFPPDGFPRTVLMLAPATPSPPRTGNAGLAAADPPAEAVQPTAATDAPAARVLSGVSMSAALLLLLLAGGVSRSSTRR